MVAEFYANRARAQDLGRRARRSGARH